jgi:nitrogen regulatory protein P-II 1
MKQIIAIIKPHQLEYVEKALHLLDHQPGFTLFGVHGHHRRAGPNHAEVADEWCTAGHNNLFLMIYCDDAHVLPTVEAIHLAAHTGNPGDGLIAVSDVDSIVRIRTGVCDDDAV